MTYEGVLEMFRETDRRFQETARQMKATDKKISALGSRIGKIIENMIGKDIVGKFRVFGYEITQFHRNTTYEYKKLGIRGEIDLFLEGGKVAILIEVTGLAVKFYQRIFLLPSFLRRQKSRETGLTLYV